MRPRLWALLILSSAGTAEAETAKTRDMFWQLGLGGQRHLFKSGEDFNLAGSSMVVQIGRGYVGESWYASGSVDIIAGPYEPVQKEAQTLDYAGTGLTIWWGHSAENFGIRTDQGNYGFSLGMSYADIIGRTVGLRRYQRARNDVPAGVETVEDYVVRVNSFTITPAIFFCWLREPRLATNRPESLVTRIEGYLLTLGVATPLIANYQVKYKSTVDAGEGPKKLSTVTARGPLNGYSLILSLTALLGV